MKWDRISHLSEDLFANKRVMDLGAHCGYYMFRALAYQPSFILGVDPMPLAYFQFISLYQYIRPINMAYLLMGIDDLSEFNGQFDTLLSMGILYHRRDHHLALSQMRDLLAENGQIILETLVLPGDGDKSIVPVGRYAAMPNVRELPTLLRLERWLNKAQLSFDLIHVSDTTVAEQRPTEWSTPESLASFLNSEDPSFTREGYPAPRRAIVRCKRL
jgi:tRNA (mo5U34)-methyltransferase